MLLPLHKKRKPLFAGNSFAWKRTLLVVGVFICAAFVHIADAAILSVSPSSQNGSYSTGQLFSVAVLVSTADGEPMNAVSGTLSFPTAILQLVSVDKTGSIIDFWISNPTYSNTQGQAQFEGGVYNPGYSGPNGRIINFLFKAKTTGKADISFLAASVLANDGKGTNILERTNAASVTIVEGVAPPAISNIPGILVQSSTHPDETKWYASNAVALSWQLPAGTTAIRSDIDKNPQGTPKTLSSPPITETNVSLEDGVSYFHIQGRDSVGWGPVTTFKIQIDTSQVLPPQFDQFAHLLTEGEVLLMSGTTYPASTVTVYVRDSSGLLSSQTTQSGSDGHFQMVWGKHLSHDIYSINAEVTNQHGLVSPRSSDVTVTVQQKAFDRYAWPILNYLTMAIIIISVLGLGILWTWYLIHRFRLFRKKVRSDVKKANQLIHVEFKKLLDRAANKRKLTAEESKMMTIIREAMKHAEEDIERDVKEIGE